MGSEKTPRIALDFDTRTPQIAGAHSDSCTIEFGAFSAQKSVCPKLDV